jgi:DnaJ-class molecular chaperone
MRFNWHKQKHITLDEGEYFCKKCNGSGVVSRSNSYHKRKGSLICNECLGEGKLDWVEKAVGKKLQ